MLGELFKQDKLSIALIPFFKQGEDVVDELTGKVYLHKKYTLNPKKTFSYAYCSDTMYYEKVVPYIENSTVLYHEATFLEKDRSRAKATYHSTAIDAAKIAEKAKVGRLLLGHLSARFENVEVVEDGNIYEVK